jgi:hypothetical protein
MEKGKITAAKVLIVIISFFCIDGGRSIFLVSNNLQILINQNHITDVELPHQHQLENFNDEEKFLETSIFDFSCLEKKSLVFQYTLNNITTDYSDSIWQPPKFV